jgi:hypothetical protein
VFFHRAEGWVLKSSQCYEISNKYLMNPHTHQPRHSPRPCRPFLLPYPAPISSHPNLVTGMPALAPSCRTSKTARSKPPITSHNIRNRAGRPFETDNEIERESGTDSDSDRSSIFSEWDAVFPTDHSHFSTPNTLDSDDSLVRTHNLSSYTVVDFTSPGTCPGSAEIPDPATSDKSNFFPHDFHSSGGEMYGSHTDTNLLWASISPLIS